MNYGWSWRESELDRQVTLKLRKRERKGELANAKTRSWEGPSFFKEQEVILQGGGREEGKCPKN